MQRASFVLVTAISLPVASADVGFDNFFLGYENTHIDSSGGDISGDSLLLKREFPMWSSLAVGAEYSRTQYDDDIDQHTAILQGLVSIPDDDFTLVFGAGWLATRVDAGTLEVDEDGPIYSLQGRFRLSEKLGLLLGVDRIELDEETGTNAYRADLLMSDGESLVDIVFSYEVAHTSGSDDDVETYGLGLRCSF